MDSSLMTCALKIDTEAAGWHKAMIKVLKNITGVSYSIDAEEGVAYVTGRIEAGKLLRGLKKSGKHAELCWVRAGDHHHHSYYPNNGHYDEFDYHNSYMGIDNNYWDDSYNYYNPQLSMPNPYYEFNPNAFNFY